MKVRARNCLPLPEETRRGFNQAERCRSAWAFKQACAGIYHLVDLKRAGHSPTRTEHVITPDREQGMQITPPLAAVSFEGSHFE